MTPEINDESKLTLRVFKRSNRYLVLLWRRIEGADPNKTLITFKGMRDKNARINTVQKFKIDEPLADGLTDLNVSTETVICVLNEEENGLDPKEAYYVKVKYGGIEEGIRLTPAGVFPSHEKEDRKKNVHLMAWDERSQSWRKVTGVRGKKGEFFLGVVLVQEKEDGEE